MGISKKKFSLFELILAIGFIIFSIMVLYPFWQTLFYLFLIRTRFQAWDESMARTMDSGCISICVWLWKYNEGVCKYDYSNIIRNIFNCSVHNVGGLSSFKKGFAISVIQLQSSS